jgi:hypothetical protein
MMACRYHQLTEEERGLIRTALISLVRDVFAVSPQSSCIHTLTSSSLSSESLMVMNDTNNSYQNQSGGVISMYHSL